MKNKSAYIKYIGNGLTVLAIILIIKKLLSYDLDYKMLFQPATMAIFIICVFAYALNVILSTIPWMKMVEIISGKKMPFITTMFVNVRSNLLKYIPGNVFQYIGKNELAIKCSIGHGQVATATVLDVIVMLVTALILGSLCIKDYFFTVIKTYVSVKYVVALGAGAAILFFFVVLLIIKKKLQEKILLILRNKTNPKKLAVCVFYYILQNLWVGAVYMTVLFVISGNSFREIPVLLIMGANIISGVIGFVVPGAPGGLGIREVVMILITQGMFDESVIMLSSVVYRIISVISDGLAFLIGLAALKISNGAKEEQGE